MTTIALFGAGGKMGCRITDNLKNKQYDMRYIEISDRGLENLKQRGLSATPQGQAVGEADIVVLAVPDVALQKVSSGVVPQMKPGSMLVMLDPAAAYLGHIDKREDISIFITHPCHPPVFNDEADPAARRDFFGGVKAKQAIVCALMQGPETDYAKGEELAKSMYAPILRSHRITLEQMAMLEPSMAETTGATCATILKEALDEVVRRGVPYEAAKDFMMGHINIELAIVFGEAGNPFSDAALVAIEYGKQHLLKSDWKKVFEPDNIRENIYYMLHPDEFNKDK